MAQKDYYVDSCIWLNLFKKEGDPTKGVPYWKIAKDFIDKVMFSEDKEIFYSGLIVREIQFKLNDEELLNEMLKFLKGEPKFSLIEVIKEDQILARQLESKSNFEISFYDCIHIAICKRLNLLFVTRDSRLIEFAKEFIFVDKPENLLG